MARLTWVVFGALLALGAGSALAAPVTWTFSGSGGNLGYDERFAADGNVLDVYGFNYGSAVLSSGMSAMPTLTKAAIRQSALGIGVCTEGSGSECEQVDTNGALNELVKIVLPSAASDFSFVFSYVDGDDTLALFGEAEGGTGLTTLMWTGAIRSLVTPPDGSISDSDQFLVSLSASDRYNVLWLSSTRDTRDGYSLRSLTVEIPEPGTLGVLGAAILALGWLRRRRG
jgi:hypothetical protein